MIITHEIAKQTLDNHSVKGKLQNFYNTFSYEDIYESTKDIKPNKNENFEKDREERLHILYNNLQEVPKCPICSKDINFISFNRGYFKSCSLSCHGKRTANKRVTTTKERHGEDYYSNHSRNYMNSRTEEEKEKFHKSRKQTWLEKYGTDDILNSSEVKEKVKKYREEHLSEIIYNTKQTCLDRYGVDSVAKLPEVQEKKNNTCLERYGEKTALLLEEHKGKGAEAFFEKYGVNNPWEVQEFKDKRDQTMIDKYGTTVYPYKSYSMISQKLFWNIYNKLPKELQESCYFAERKRETWLTYRNRDNKLCYYFYDFSIMSLQLLVEFQGTFWHDHTLGNEWSDKVLDKDLHKKQIAEENNFTLLYVYEKEYRENPEEVETNLLYQILELNKEKEKPN